MRAIPVAAMSLRVLALALVAQSCATVQRDGDRAFERADYISAVGFYESALAARPGDLGLQARLWMARNRALLQLAGRVGRELSAGRRESARSGMRELLAIRERWSYRPGLSATAAVAGVVNRMGHLMIDEIDALLRARRPLAAEAVLASRVGLLRYSAFAVLRSDLRERVAAAGRDRCRALSTAHPLEPYLGLLLATYCRHFGIDPSPAVRSPRGIASVVLHGEVRGMTASQRERLAIVASEWLRRTPWFGAEGEALVATIAGRQHVHLTAEHVDRSISWVESVPHSQLETSRQSYQEPFMDTEHYTISVPQHGSRTDSYSCGFGSQHRTCTRSVPTTTYRTEFRTRSVMRFRTAYRTAYRRVTRFRPEPRVFTYAALLRRAHYAGTWTLSIPLGDDGPPLRIRVESTAAMSGDEHDVTFAPAGIAPSRASLLSEDDWFAHLAGQLEDKFVAGLSARWSESFCRSRAYTPEDAARCAYLSDELPPAVRTALAELFGADLDQALVLYRPK